MDFIIKHIPFYIMALGAGLSVFIGIFVSRLKFFTDDKKNIATGFAIGVLIYLFVEITSKMLENVEELTRVAFRLGDMGAFGLSLLYVAMFIIGFILLENISHSIFKTNVSNMEEPKRSLAIATMIAAGIGLHNFSEGLVIGQEYAVGAMNLALVLAIGFGLHNATEGFGIAAPLVGIKASIKRLFWLACIAGLPTFIGAVVGNIAYAGFLEISFLALASGAILYIIGQLWHAIKKSNVAETTLLYAITAGFIFTLYTDIFLKYVGG